MPRAIVGGLLVAALAACLKTPPPPPPPPPPAPTLVGEWRVVAVNGRPTSGKMTITPPMLRSNFGCNEGRSSVRIEPGKLIVVMPMSVTERGCVNADDSPTAAVQHEDEGFRIASRHMTVAFYGPATVRLSNEAGTIDLKR